MQQIPLKALIDLAYQQATKILIGGVAPELAPMWVLIDRDGKIDLMMTPFANPREKLAVEHAMRALIKDRGVTQYSFLCEAWSATQADPYDPKRDRPASERPDRIEIVMALAVSAEGKEQAVWRMVRNEARKPVALELIDSGPSQSLYDRFGDLLAPRPSLQ